MMRSLYSGFLPLLLVLGACGRGEPMKTAESRDDALTTANGVSLNGVSLNGVSLNGVSLNGVSLNGVSLNGVSLNGVSLNGVSLNGAQLVGVTANGRGTAVSGSQLTGASMSGLLSDGSTLPIRVDAVSRGSGSNADVWFYDVSYRSDDAWLPLCGEDATGDPIAAVALAGTWDYSQGTSTGGSWTPSSTSFTFGCRLTALAKCVEMGYKPWASENGTSLRTYHQACTRLLRADYCGDGTPWTVNGRKIDLYDGIGVQQMTRPFWLFEAEWDDGGANCVSTQRVIDLHNLLGTVSRCILSRVSLTCGFRSHFQNGTLLMNRYQAPTISLF